MAAGFVIRKNQYYDSVFLLRVAKNLFAEPGVQECAILMATDANKERLAELGIRSPEVTSAGPNDLVVAIQSEDKGLIDRLLGEMDQRLTSTSTPDTTTIYHSVEAAAASTPQSNLVVVSVPGAYAAREARKALEAGKHVFLFSDNVPVEQEVELKQVAVKQHRLVMGPDCGTSLIGGVGIGFANRVRRGPVGVVGASGTGIQEFTSLIHQAGSGISHAIGTGTHDLSDAVGGITTLMGLDVLEADPDTQVIVVISKPAGLKTLALLQERIRRCRKPVIGCLLGLRQTIEHSPSFGGPGSWGPNFRLVKNIDQAVDAACASLEIQVADLFYKNESFSPAAVEQIVQSWLPEQRYVRGLFAGGTFCFQAQQVLQEAEIPVYSNTPLDGRYRLENPEQSLEHTLIDLGDDYFTNGKPHPMIDAGERCKRILQEAADPEVAILLLDFILGEISSPDPVGDLIGAIQQARQTAARRGGRLTVVASVCGTDQDTQGLERQREMLQSAGVYLLPSSAKAAEFCLDLLRCAGGKQHG